MAKRYRIVNLSPTVRSFESNLVQPRTSRVLELQDGVSESQIERMASRNVFIKETSEDAQNGQPLPLADPNLVEAYARLSTAQGSDREALVGELGFGPKAKAPATAPKKAEG